MLITTGISSFISSPICSHTLYYTIYQEESQVKNVQYLLSVQVLKGLLAKGLITKKEFRKIDAKNRKTFLED